MQSQDYAAHMKQWLSDMAADSGSSRIDRGPVETLSSRPGYQAPKRNKKGGRVPAYSSGQQKKL
jgi:hypothetical protein